MTIDEHEITNRLLKGLAEKNIDYIAKHKLLFNIAQTRKRIELYR